MRPDSRHPTLQLPAEPPLNAATRGRRFPTLLAPVLIFLAGITGTWAEAASLGYLGAQSDLGAGWRTAAVRKPHDPDHDNILGTDGYHLVNRPPVRPAYLAGTEILSGTYPGNIAYASIDDPTSPSVLFLTGTMNPYPGTGVSADLFRFTLGATAAGRTIRVGLLVDNLDVAGFNAASLTLVQTSGTGATTGPVATTTPAFNNRIPDWLFFEITGGAAGDVFVVRGVGGPNATATLGGVAFDSAITRTNIINVAYWRLGENDPGAVDGAPAGSTINLAGGPMALYEGSTYSGEVSPGAATQAGSTLGLRFDGISSGSSGPAFGLTDNFGLELWVKPAHTGDNQCLAYNGTDQNGWGLYLSDGRYQVLYGGWGMFTGDGATATANVWTHLAFVRDSGTSALFVNGALVTANAASPHAPSDTFRVATSPFETVPDSFTGVLDELRVFRFAPGGFTAADLLFTNGPALSAVTEGPTLAGSTTATLNGAVHRGKVATTVWFEWGTTTNYGNITAPAALVPTSAVRSVSHNLHGLTGNTTYHYRVAASNALGLSYGADASFVTPALLDVTASLAPGLPAVSRSTVAWGDYDNDGRLDFLLTGHAASGPVSQLWRNTGNGFTNVPVAGLPGVGRSSVAWGDFDQDGRLDFLLTGAGGVTGISQLWQNTGSGFANVSASLAPGLPAVSNSCVAWIDFDNDGRLDFLLAGRASAGSVVQLWRNTGNRFINVMPSVAPGLSVVSDAAVAWGDFDGDGRVDFLLTGFGNNGPTSQLWRNTGGSFTDVTGTVAPGLPGVTEATAAWGDYDNDGRLDLLIAGFTGKRWISQIWRNTSGGFVDVTGSVAPGLPATLQSAVGWGDFDNDGRLDFLLAGSTGGSPISQLWRNTGGGFARVAAGVVPGLTGVGNSSVAWGDFDNDGRLDLLLTGDASSNGDPVSRLLRNETAVTNTPPTAPTGLAMAPSGAGIAFIWNAAGDAETPVNGLAYHLRVGTTPGGSELSSPMAGGTGQARLPRAGALQPGRIRTLTGLPFARTIYWSVQAADTTFAGSPFAPEQSFTLGIAFAPTNGVVIPGDTNGDGVVSPEEFAVVRAGLTNEPATQNATGYYTPAQLQMQNGDTPLLGRTNGQFKLTLGLERSTQLTNFTTFPFVAPRTTINGEGEIEFRFNSPDGAVFYRGLAK